MADKNFIQEFLSCVCENNDFFIRYNLMSYPDDTRKAVMFVAILKDGKIFSLESGAMRLDLFSIYCV